MSDSVNPLMPRHTTEPDRAAITKAKTLTYLVITTIVFVGTATVGLPVAGVSVMLFDAPGSENNPVTIAIFWSMVTYPAVCVLAVVASWFFYLFRLYLLARVVALLPLINVVAGAIAFLCSGVFYGGRLNG